MIFPLLAVDIGNARMKIGVFDTIADDSLHEKKGTGTSLRSEPVPFFSGLPEPARTLPLEGDEPQFDSIGPWLDDLAGQKLPWFLASVNRPGATRLIDWLSVHRPDDLVTLLSAGDLPLVVRVDRPDMVGIDRLVDAVAVNRVREPGRSAVIVDVGTAITVDLVAADGAFLGGSILPGLRMSARALNEFTDLLPLVDVSELSEPPPALGTSTEAAMRSGLFWGTVGAIRQLIEQLGHDAGDHPQIFLTGGAGAAVAELLGPDAQFVPHITLAGIVLAMQITHK